MDLLKKHYEKIILGGVLLILAVGAALLPVMIGKERDDLNEKEQMIIVPPKPLEPLNFSTQQLRIAELKTAGVLDLATTNKVFNPLLWQKGADGRILKIKTGDETGPKALVVTKVTPLAVPGRWRQVTSPATRILRPEGIFLRLAACWVPASRPRSSFRGCTRSVSPVLR